MSAHIISERHGAVLQLTLSRPEKKNALTGEMYLALIEAILAADKDEEVAAIVLAGGEGVFTAGNDIGDFLKAGQLHDFETMPALVFIRTLASATTPMIAAVDGLAIGIGTTLTLHCDLVYATSRTRFRMPFVDLALVPEAAASLIIPHRVGLAKATEWLMLGEAYDASEALRLGLINAILEPHKLLAHALAQGQKLATKPRKALAATRRLIRGDTSALLARIEMEMHAFAEGMKSAEARQVYAAFLAKSKDKT